MKKILRSQFGQTVKELRLLTGMSQEAFADECGMARSYMSRIERGGSNVSLDAIQALAEALKVEPWQLFIECKSLDDQNSVAELYVPYAYDGSCFNPSLSSPRDGSFKVGEKGDLKRFDSFEEALDFLRSMEIAKWFRPNLSGNWGHVSAVKWDRMK